MKQKDSGILSNHRKEFLIGIAIAIFILIAEGTKELTKFFFEGYAGIFLGVIFSVLILFWVFYEIAKKEESNK